MLFTKTHCLMVFREIFCVYCANDTKQVFFVSKGRGFSVKAGGVYSHTLLKPFNDVGT